MQSDSDIADYTQRVAQAWGVGQKERRNGVVLFLFLQDRKMIIQVGYGLEGALPDATAFNITEYQMKPRGSSLAITKAGYALGLIRSAGQSRANISGRPRPSPSKIDIIVALYCHWSFSVLFRSVCSLVFIERHGAASLTRRPVHIGRLTGERFSSSGSVSCSAGAAAAMVANLRRAAAVGSEVEAARLAAEGRDRAGKGNLHTEKGQLVSNTAPFGFFMFGLPNLTLLA